jgi:hypothetical protein
MLNQALPYSGEDTNQQITNTQTPFTKMAFLDTDPEIQYLYASKDAQLLRIFDALNVKSQAVDSQVVNWEEDTRQEISTTFSATAAAQTAETTGSVTFADGYRITNNCHVFVPETGELMQVVSVVRSTGVATVKRAINGSAGAIAVGYHAVVTPAYAAERSDVELSVGKAPVQPMNNYVSTFAESISITQRAKNLGKGILSLGGNMSKWEWARLEHFWDVRKRMQFSMMFEARRMENTVSGQKYIAGGLTAFISQNIFDFGQVAGNANWPALNEMIERTFRPTASTDNKIFLAGENLFMSMYRIQRAMTGNMDKPYYSPNFGTDSFVLTTDGGKNVTVVKDRFVLSLENGLHDFGFLVDMGNVERYHFNGMDLQWINGIQNPREVFLEEDAFVGSFGLALKHDDTHAMFRGGASMIIGR